MMLQCLSRLTFFIGKLPCHIYYTPASKERGFSGLALSVLPSETDIFHCIFLRNRASQPLQTWYGASARGHSITYRIQVLQLSTSCFRTWFIFRHSVRNQYFPSHFSQQPCITATSNMVWCFG